LEAIDSKKIMELNRQLRAILFADIEGYTTFMQESEEVAIQLINRFKAVLKQQIPKHNGTIVQYYGDGCLVTFLSAAQAVSCAVQLQETYRNKPNVPVRIGIHSGEVVFEEENVFGDSVNIASRIESIGVAGSILVSKAIRDQIKNKQEFKLRSLGGLHFKNVKEPLEVFAVSNEGLNLPTSILPKYGAIEATHTGAYDLLNNTDKGPFKPRHENHQIVPASEDSSIAVLPFADMSASRDQGYFCEGIAEEILNSLNRIEGLRVSSRMSSFQFQGTGTDLRKAGQQLNVSTVLEGSVRKAGNRLRVNVHLINVADGFHLWSERYDGDLEDIFAVQDDIAEKVAVALRGMLTPREKDVLKRPETNIEAYEWFLRGRQHMNQLNFDAAGKMYRKAISIDPDYAPAYAGLANIHSWRFEWFGGKSKDLELADLNSNKALELAPYLAESHTARGYMLSQRRKYKEAEKAFSKAVQLDPNSFDSYYFYARTCFANGEIERSAELFKLASEARPDDFQSMSLLAQSLSVLGRTKEAHQARTEAIKRAGRQLELDPNDRRVLSLVAGNLYEDGQHDRAFQFIKKALQLYPEDAGVLVNAACLYARAGMNDDAINILNRVFGLGYGKRDWIEHDPDYDSLREDPRFQDMLDKLP
jgi:adenylate cyclase